MYYKTLNLKDNMPTVAVAEALLEIEIEACKQEGILVLKVIHGYGSHGVGGEIKKALSVWLKLKKRSHFIKDYVSGDAWLTSNTAQRVKSICPEVMGDVELFSANPGITIILI